MPGDREELARRLLAAVSEGDGDAIGELVHPEVEIRTARRVHRGRAEAVEWGTKAYDHVVRRFVPVEIERRPEGVEVRAELQYTWRESGEVGDSSPIEIELGIRDGLVSSWRFLGE